MDWPTNIFFLVLAGAATAVSWWHPMRAVGLSLLTASAISIIAVLNFPFGARVIIEIALAVLITIVSAWGWSHHGGRAYQVIIAAAFVDVCFSGAVALHGSMSNFAQWLFSLITNILFMIQCVAAAAPGVRDAFRSWIAAIDSSRVDHSAHPEMDWLLHRLDDE